jgi:hypothetical protein
MISLSSSVAMVARLPSRREGREELVAVGDGHRGDVDDASAGDEDRGGFRAEAGAVALGAARVGEVLGIAQAGFFGVGLAPESLHAGDDAFPFAGVFDGAFAALESHVILAGAGAIEDDGSVFGGEVGEGSGEADAMFFGDGLEHSLEPLGGGEVEAFDGSVFEGEGGVGHDAVGVDAERGAEAVAAMAHAERAVEAEGGGAEFGEADVAVGAEAVLAEEAVFAAFDGDDELAFAAFEGGLDGVGDAGADVRAGDEAVDDDLDGVAAFFVEGDLLLRGSTSPLMRRRAKPARRMSSTVSLCSPFRFSTMGASTRYLVRSGNAMRVSTICSADWGCTGRWHW